MKSFPEENVALVSFKVLTDKFIGVCVKNSIREFTIAILFSMLILFLPNRKDNGKV